MRCLSAVCAIAYAGGMAMWVAASSPAIAQEEWKMHHPWVDSRQEAINVRKLADRVSAATDGAFEINIYSGGSLGINDADILRVLPRGNAVQVAFTSVTYLTRDAPAIAYSMPEGILSSPEDMPALMSILDDIYEEEFGKWNIKYLGSLLGPDQAIGIYCREPVRSLEDLRSKRLRVWSGILVDNFERIGVSTAVIPQNELYIALQTGVVDCATYYAGPANTISLHEVAPYWAELTYFAVPGVVIASEQAWNELSEPAKRALESSVKELSKELMQEYLDGSYEMQQREVFAQAGGEELEPFSQEDRTTYRESALETWRSTMKGLGEPAATYYETLRQALSE